MRDAVIAGKFYALRIYKHKSDLIWRKREEITR